MDEYTSVGRRITTRDATIACAISGIVCAVLSWVIFAAPGGAQIAEDAGSAADWVAAFGGCIAAVATIVIGRAAHTFTVEAEAGRRADMKKEKRRSNEMAAARLRAMRNTARRALYPSRALGTLFRAIRDQPIVIPGPEIEGVKDLTDYDRRTRDGVRIQIEMTLRYLDTMRWNEEFKTALDDDSIDALFEVERLEMWYRTMANQMLSQFTAAEANESKRSAAKKKQEPPYDAADDKNLPALKHMADALRDAAKLFIDMVEIRKREFTDDH
ncbi:TPA: hypothetical protein ACKPZU_000093 [Stenotrophomonas maltophilia]